MISGQNIGIFGWKTRDFRAKAFFSKRILAGGGPRMRGFAIAPRLRGPALRVFLEEKMLDILVKWGIFELNMRDSQAKDGIFVEKTRVFQLKSAIFPKEFFSRKKRHFWGVNAGFSGEKWHFRVQEA